MARLTRKTLTQFAGSAVAAALGIGKFGSAAAASPIFSTDPTVIQGLAAWLAGWSGAVLGSSKFPALEDMNAVAFVHSYMQAYVFQEGIPEWDAGTTYYVNGIVKGPGTMQLFGSLTNANTNNALPVAPNSNADWKFLIDLGGTSAYLQIADNLSDVADPVASLNNIGGGRSVVGAMQNAKMSVTAANASGTFTADEIIVESALGGVQKQLVNYNQTVNLATTGAGGMDTGAAPVSGYVALYAIYNPTGPATSILAVDVTSLLAPSIYAGGHMPSGYTQSALIGVWPTDGSSRFVQGIQFGKSINFSSKTILNSASNVGSFTNLSIAGAIPRNAKYIKGYMGFVESTSSSHTTQIAIAGDANGTGQATVQMGLTSATGDNMQGSFSEVPIITSQTIYYISTTDVGTVTAYTIYVNGYTI